jgi:hypothetical protein
VEKTEENFHTAIRATSAGAALTEENEVARRTK